MGSRGPIGKRSSEILGHRSKEEMAEWLQIARGPTVTVPEPDPTWHLVALEMYLSFGTSGQASEYQSSDWALAYATCESMSRDLEPKFMGFEDVYEDGRKDGQVAVWDSKPIPGASMGAYLKAFSLLLATVGDRRRLKMELQQPIPEIKPENDGPATGIDNVRSITG